jgi:hypothetical protein
LTYVFQPCTTEFGFAIVDQFGFFRRNNERHGVQWNGGISFVKVLIQSPEKWITFF